MAFQTSPRGDADGLTVAIEHVGPIELRALADSLAALSAMYARYAERERLPLPDERVRLFVREIRSGSILVDLVAVASQAPVVAEHAAMVAKSVAGFAGSVRDVIDHFRGVRAEPPKDLDKRDADDIRRVVEPVAIQPGASIGFVARDNAQVTVNLVLPSNDAAAVQRRAEHYSSLQSLPATGLHRRSLFYWHQAQDKVGGAAGDRGVIEAISARPVKTVFANERAKAEMLGEALFRFAYVVDVDVQTIGGQPRLYKVLEVRDRVERED